MPTHGAKARGDAEHDAFGHRVERIAARDIDPAVGGDGVDEGVAEAELAAQRLGLGEDEDDEEKDEEGDDHD